jgi:hypothetical protein
MMALKAKKIDFATNDEKFKIEHLREDVLIISRRADRVPSHSFATNAPTRHAHRIVVTTGAACFVSPGCFCFKVYIFIQ